MNSKEGHGDLEKALVQRDQLLNALKDLLAASCEAHIELKNAHSVRLMSKFIEASENARAVIATVQSRLVQVRR